MREISKKKIKDILADHALWLKDRSKGNKANFFNVKICLENFAGMDLSYVSFYKSKLHHINFTNAILFETSFNESEITNTFFNNADLRNSSFKFSELNFCTFNGADCSGANFENVDFGRVMIRWAKLIGASFCNSRLGRANLRSSNLIGSDIDFSSLPLSCRGLDWEIDERIAAQLAYHFCSMRCENREVKEAQNALLNLANKFHRVEECGLIEQKVIE